MLSRGVRVVNRPVGRDRVKVSTERYGYVAADRRHNLESRLRCAIRGEARQNKVYGVQ